MISARLDDLAGTHQGICVIGAGPVGISLALELARLGQSVLLLESGGTAVHSDAQRLADAEIADPKHHVPMDIAVARRLGGTSNLWGGRCVEMEELDFTTRPAIPQSGWPIGMQDVEPYIPAACDYIGCGQPVFRSKLPDVLVDDPDFAFDRLERWSERPRFRTAYARRLRESHEIDLRLRATVVGFDYAADGRVSGVRVRGPDDVEVAFTACRVVLAGGGLENTRLLLAARQTDPNRFGGEDGPLGRYYMGHVYGSAAEMVINAPALDAGLDYFQDRDGCYIRRRFTASADLQQRMGLSNAALWPDYPPIYNASHRNGILSFAYLSLAMPWIGRMIVVESIRRNYVGPGPVRPLGHIANIVRELPRTAMFIPEFLYRRYLARHRMPGFFQRNAARRYAVRYHAEHLPNPDSRVTLSGERDAYGLPRLAIDLRYTAADAAPLIRTHECFADWLERTGLGSMTWSVPKDQLADHIVRQCYDGHHQIGTTRMGDTARTGVVDADCRVFGSANLFVAGSSVFPTSGAANPTLTAVALALRLAALLTREASA